MDPDKEPMITVRDLKRYISHFFKLRLTRQFVV